MIHEASRPAILLGQEHRLVHSIDATCGCREDQIAAFEIVNHGAFSTRPGDLHVESRAPALAQLQWFAFRLARRTARQIENVNILRRRRD